MEEITDRAPRDARPGCDFLGERGRAGRRGSGLRAASEAAAVVSAAVLAGGGAGMLAGVALGAINPFGLGPLGAAAGACVPALLTGRPWWRG